MKSTFLLCCIAFLAALHQANAIECYKCNSAIDGDKCNDPFSKDGIATVKDMEVCVKTKSELSGVQEVGRDGSATSPGKSGCESTTTHGVKTITCNCDTNLCNTAAATWIPLALLITCVIFGKAFY